MAQIGCLSSSRLTGQVMTTTMMTVQCSLSLVQIVGCMSHKQPAQCTHTRNNLEQQIVEIRAKKATGKRLCAGHHTLTLASKAKQSLRLEVLSDLSEIGIRFRHRLARRQGIEPYTHVPNQCALSRAALVSRRPRC